MHDGQQNSPKLWMVLCVKVAADGSVAIRWKMRDDTPISLREVSFPDQQAAASALAAVGLDFGAKLVQMPVGEASFPIELQWNDDVLTALRLHNDSERVVKNAFDNLARSKKALD